MNKKYRVKLHTISSKGGSCYVYNYLHGISYTMEKQKGSVYSKLEIDCLFTNSHLRWVLEQKDSWSYYLEEVE